MAEDPYTLPHNDPCHSTLEAFKHITGAGVDAAWQALQYRRFRARLDAWQQCCPALKEKVAALTPAVTDPATLGSFTMPASGVRTYLPLAGGRG
jgi:hypothetical protein